MFGVVGCFLNSKDINELATLYNETNIMYRQDFVELVCKIGLYKKFDDLQFAEFLEKANIRIDRILREKDIVYKFGKVVREYILKDAENALKNNKLLVENTLFSRPEQDYLDYLLNKHKFSNGLDLRNKYIHSTNSLDEKVHRDDYMRFLIVMAIIIIKINEEFCLKEKLKK
ncbi:MAG: hypothetical protein ACLS3Z_02360 [Faecalibacterium sp.]